MAEVIVLDNDTGNIDEDKDGGRAYAGTTDVAVYRTTAVDNKPLYVSGVLALWR